MNALMMDVPLTLQPLFERAGRLFGNRSIVWRRPDRSVARHSYRQFHARTQQLANALSRLGLAPGDRVATLAWNHGRHLEAYFAVPLAGFVLHTVNPRLSPQDLAFIMNDASDRVLQRAAGTSSPAALQHRAEEWRPWRAYAALHLWLYAEQRDAAA